MAKLGKQYYKRNNGTIGINNYKVNIPKSVVQETTLDGVELKIYSKDNKIIIEKK